MTRISPWKAVAVGILAGLLFLAGATRSPLIGLVGVLSAVAGLAVLREPGLGMGVLTFLLPLERMQRLTNDDATFTISLMRLVAAACLASIVLARVHQRRSLRIDRSMLFFGVYVLLAILGLAYSTDPYGTKRFLGTILSNCLLLVLYFNYFQERRQIRRMIAVWLAANLLGCAYSAYDWHRGSGASGAQKLVDPGKGTQSTTDRWSTVWEDKSEWDAQKGVALRRSAGPTSHPSVYGLNLVMTVPFYLALLRLPRPLWQQAGLLVALGLTGYNILLSNTRGTLLGTVFAGILCVGYGLVRLHRWHLPAVLLVVSLLIPVVPQDALKRMLDPANYTRSGSSTLRIRLQYWDAGWRILQDHFLFGLGVGNERAVPAYLPPGTEFTQQSVHNIYLQIALETGVFGWLGFFTFVGMVFHRTRTAARLVRHRPGWETEHGLLLAMQVAMLTVLAYGLQVDVFNFSLKGWWLLTSMALALYHWSLQLESSPAGLPQPRPGGDAALPPANPLPTR